MPDLIHDKLSGDNIFEGLVRMKQASIDLNRQPASTSPMNGCMYVNV